MQELIDVPDKSEKHLGAVVTEMSPFQLVSYLKDAMEIRYGIELRIDGAGAKERAVMTQLQKVYGEAGAGHILKFVIIEMLGKDEKGKPVTFFSFSKARKWWTDELYGSAQVRAQMDRKKKVTEKQAVSGFGTLTGFLRG